MAQNLVTKFFSICVLNSTGKSVGNLLDNIYVCSMLIIITILFFLLYSHCCSRTNLFSLSLSLQYIDEKSFFCKMATDFVCCFESGACYTIWNWHDVALVSFCSAFVVSIYVDEKDTRKVSGARIMFVYMVSLHLLIF